MDESKSKFFQLEIPPRLNPNLNFSASNIPLPVGEWDVSYVSYAIQFKGKENDDNDYYSLISPWSTNYTLDRLACPVVSIDSFDSPQTTRIIFRTIYF